MLKKGNMTKIQGRNENLLENNSKYQSVISSKAFGAKRSRVYSSLNNQFVYIFFSGTKKMEYKTRQWHEKCFCCNVCKTPIGTKSFIPREQEIYCAGCYEEKYATRCIKCDKVSLIVFKGI